MKKLALFLILMTSFVFSHDELAEQVHAITLKIEQTPNRAELYFQRAELYRADSHWKKAELDYEQGRKLAPEMAATDLGLGLLYLSTHRYQESKQALDRFVARHPDHAEAHVGLGRALSKLGERMEAVEEYSKAVALHPDPEIYIERSQLLKEENKTEEALTSLDEGIRKLGPVVTLELSAIDLELHLKQYDGALARVERIATQSERKEAWLARKGEILTQAARKEEALTAYLLALDAIANLPQSRKSNRYTQELEERIRRAVEQLEKSHVK